MINWILTQISQTFVTVADVQQCFVGPLDLTLDISLLAGHSLIVTEKHNVQKRTGHSPLKKAASVGYRSTTANRLFSSVSAEEELSDTAKAATKQTKQRWTLQLFGVKVKILIWKLFSLLLPHVCIVYEIKSFFSNHNKNTQRKFSTESSTESTLWAAQLVHEAWRAEKQVFLSPHRAHRWCFECT